MDNLIKRTIAAFAENWDNGLAIVICLSAGVLKLVGNSRSEVLVPAAITWAIALVAIGSIKDRRARDQLRDAIQAVEKRPASDVLRDRARFRPFHEGSASARDISMFGASLSGIIGSQRDHLVSLIVNCGAKVKVLTLDENASVVESAALCLDMKADKLRAEILAAEQTIQEMLEKVRNCETTGSIAFKKTHAFPNYGLTIVDPDLPNGYLTVEYNGYKEETYLRPHIELTRTDSEALFKLYRNDFTLLWDGAREVVSSAPERRSAGSTGH